MIALQYSPEMPHVMGPDDDLAGCGCDCGQVRENEGSEAARFPDPCRRRILIYADPNVWAGEHRMGMDFGTFVQNIQRAADDWAAVCGLRFVISTNRADLEPAHVYLKPSHEFGQNVLADSHLADGSCGDHFRQRYDIRRWTVHLLYLTALHELGHLLGLRHKNGPFVMNPTILTRLQGLTQDDIKRAVALYGPPLEDPDPDPDPEPDPEPPPPEDKPVNWFDFLLKVAPIALECLQRDHARALHRIRAGDIGLRATIELWREARERDIKGRKKIRAYVATARDEIAAEAAAMSDAELMEAIHEAGQLHQALAS